MMLNLRRTNKPLLLLLPLSCLLLIAFLSLSSMFNSTKTSTEEDQIHIHIRRNLQVAHSACQGTLYPQLCVSTLSTFPDLHTKSIQDIISANVNLTVSEVRDSASNCSSIREKLRNRLDPLDRRAFDDCNELFDETVGELQTALSNLDTNTSTGGRLKTYTYADIQTLLSAAMTNQFTCLDGFAYSKKNKGVRKYFQKRLKRISKHVSNSLAMLKKIKKQQQKQKPPKPSSEVFPEYGEVKKDGFPSWLKGKDRKLLQVGVNETKIDLVVAKDGSGNFTTINEALDAAPNNSDTRFVIYIKAGAYFEYVEVVKKKMNIMLLGDGIGQTWIKGNRSVVDGWTTFRSSTVAVVGNGFIAKGISFENFAGPSKHQAVALRSGADFSAFYQCSFIGYQDTLYVHSLRQFYRDCDIYGTVDFIFGNAAVVFQNCNLYARRPSENQKNLFTAQGREDPNQNTGISLLGCKITAAADLIPVQSSFKSYLGRPWKEYSRTVVMHSYIGDAVDPAGWLEWSGDFALSSLYYGEYMNRGPGSNSSGRVSWPGFRVINSSEEASVFTVSNFIQGAEWLSATSIPFYLNLTATS